MPYSTDTEPHETIIRLLWKKKQAAEAIQCSIRHVENEVKRKALACVRLGIKAIRFRPEDVRRYIERRRVHAIGE